MNGAKNPDTGSFAVPANDKVKKPTNVRHYLYCYEQTGLVRVHLYRNNKVIESHNMTLKSLLSGKEFDAIEVEDLTGSENTVRFFHGVGEFSPASDEATVTVANTSPIDVDIGESVTISTSVPNQSDTIPDVTVGSSATLIASANASRLGVFLKIKSGESNGIRWGDSGVLAGSGDAIEEGESRYIPGTQAIYGIRDGGADVDVCVTEIENV